MRGSDTTRQILVPPDKQHFAVLMRSEPLAEPNVLGHVPSTSIVKTHFYRFSPFPIIYHLMS
jgi:hypothetical protein